MALGDELKKGRMRLKQSPSQVAAATRMKVQTVTALEEEDFSKIAAPIYAKGFIKLYARHVGLDPRPLTEEYVARFTNQPAPALLPETEAGVDEPAPSAASEPVLPETTPPAQDSDLFSHLQEEPAAAEAEAEALPVQEPAGAPAAASGRLAARLAAWGDAGRGAAAQGTAWLRARGRALQSAWQKRESPLPSLALDDLTYKHLLALLGLLVLVLFLVSGLSRCVRRPPNAGAPPPPAAAELELALDPPAAYVD